MPRLARTVFAKVPHHITQRGNRREDVFLTDGDRETYLAWLEDYCQQHGVDILAYCLMTNHIHLVAVPATEDALQHVLKPLHMRYAQRFNRQHSMKGHVWQGRYFSAPLDEPYLWVRAILKGNVPFFETQKVVLCFQHGARIVLMTYMPKCFYG